jgi:uncharacterized protein (TIGR03000 family)
MLRNPVALPGAAALFTSLLVLTTTVQAGSPGGCGVVGFVFQPVGPYGVGTAADYPGARYGYHLDDRAPSYYNGLNYREYYGYAMGEGYGFWLGPPNRYLPPDRWPACGLYQSPWDRMPKAPPGTPAPPLAAKDDKAARIVVRVPADAEVWLEGSKTRQTGAAREFISPPLESGENYVYEVRARWTNDGQSVDQTRKVEVHAGDRVSVNFAGSGDAEEVLPKPTPVEP